MPWKSLLRGRPHADPRRPRPLRKAVFGIATRAAALITACSSAQHEVMPAPVNAQQILRAGAQAPKVGSTENFTGHVRVQPLFASNEDIDVSGAYVTFEPGARSAWHTHPAGQRLVVTSGVGLAQQWGKTVQEIRSGDVIVCPPGIRHWHGAAPTSAMTHLAVTGSVNGTSVSWMDRVTDAEYAAAATATQGHRAAPDPEKATAPQGLSTRQQTIVLIAAFAAMSDMPKLNTALNQGLDAGLAISDAKEVLVQLYAYIGFPRSLNALGELMNVIEARKQRGLHDAPGREPGRAIPTGDELLAAGTANQTKIAGAPVEGPVFDFAPVINQYLRVHLFGDIFERDNLDWQSRELATVGALAATAGVESQLRSHMAASLRVGLTPEQLRQVIDVLAGLADARVSQRATDALTRALATTREIK